MKFQSEEPLICWNDLAEKFDFIEQTPIEKGWSVDKKYQVKKSNGTKYLLRITPSEHYEKRKALFSILKEVEKINIPMCKPLEMGVCQEGVYILYTWIDGVDASEIVPTLPHERQYSLGVESGEILQKIHMIPAPITQEEWHTRFNRKTDNKIQCYKKCPLKFQSHSKIIEYIENNRDLFRDRPQSFQHGDYHIGNLMLENDKIVVIDFDRFDFGDPWEEFNRIVWSAQLSPAFASGQIDGYFGGKPPIEFFQLLAFYISSNTLSSIYWAIPFGEKEVENMRKQTQDVLSWYDNMKNPVPTWYESNTK